MENKEEKIREFQQLPVFEKLQRIAKKLNGTTNIDFNNTNQCKTYLAYDYNSKSITLLATNSPIKEQGVVYCINKSFKEVAIEWIGEEELEKYLKE